MLESGGPACKVQCCATVQLWLGSINELRKTLNFVTYCLLRRREVCEEKINLKMKFLNLVALGLVLSLSTKENVLVNGHGYLIEPPSRASAWTVDPDFQKCCVEYNHNQMFCGGFSTHWEKNGGRCGICGDDFAQPEPRMFEKGGAKYLGKVVRTYLPNSLINISVVVSGSLFCHTHLAKLLASLTSSL